MAPASVCMFSPICCGLCSTRCVNFAVKLSLQWLRNTKPNQSPVHSVLCVFEILRFCTAKPARSAPVVMSEFPTPIAIVAAGAHELAVLLAALDQKCEPPSSCSDDSKLWHFGLIGNQHVVIAALPEPTRDSTTRLVKSIHAAFDRITQVIAVAVRPLLRRSNDAIDVVVSKDIIVAGADASSVRLGSASERLRVMALNEQAAEALRESSLVLQEAKDIANELRGRSELPKSFAVDAVSSVKHGSIYSGGTPSDSAITTDVLSADEFSAGLNDPSLQYLVIHGIASAESKEADEKAQWQAAVLAAAFLRCVLLPAHVKSSLGLLFF